MKALGRAPLHQHSAPPVAGMRSWSGGTHRHSVLLREQQPEPGKDHSLQGLLQAQTAQNPVPPVPLLYLVLDSGLTGPVLFLGE